LPRSPRRAHPTYLRGAAPHRRWTKPRGRSRRRPRRLRTRHRGEGGERRRPSNSRRASSTLDTRDGSACSTACSTSWREGTSGPTVGHHHCEDRPVAAGPAGSSPAPPPGTAVPTARRRDRGTRRHRLDPPDATRLRCRSRHRSSAATRCRR
jgi:hypothetical protein